MEKIEPEEYKSDFTKFNEQKAEKAKEEIKELNERFKKLIEVAEEKKKELDNSSI